MSSRQPSKNPIALRLYKVLGTNYNDESLKESLVLLTRFYETKSINDSEHSGPVPNVAFVGKNLSRDLQVRLESGSQKFLRAFEVVDQVTRLICLRVLMLDLVIARI
jgi:conserved oligomeric Golgi complex subunit 6